MEPTSERHQTVTTFHRTNQFGQGACASVVRSALYKLSWALILFFFFLLRMGVSNEAGVAWEFRATDESMILNYYNNSTLVGTRNCIEVVACDSRFFHSRFHACWRTCRYNFTVLFGLNCDIRRSYSKRFSWLCRSYCSCDHVR